MLAIFSYANCSLTKYMDRHKIKPDSKAFNLVSCLLNLFFTSLQLDLFTAAEAAHDGPQQEDHLRTFHAGPLLPRRALAHARVRISGLSLTSPAHSLFFCSIFAGCPIPYPKREFLTDDDTEEKTENKARQNQQQTVMRQSCFVRRSFLDDISHGRNSIE